MNVIDAYLEKLSASDREALQRVRNIIHDSANKIDETFSWQMPTFKYRGKILIQFAAFKNHLSIFPGPDAIENFSDQLKGYKISKGTVQFTVEKPLSDELLIGIVKYRASEIDGKAS